MQSEHDHDIKQLNDLIEAAIDSADGYQEAANTAGGSRFATLFHERAADRRHVAMRLQAEVTRLGGDAETDGTTAGAAKRWFANLKNSIVGDEAAVVSDVEAGEDHIKEMFETVMQDPKLAASVHGLVSAVYRTIKVEHDEIRDLKKREQASNAD